MAQTPLELEVLAALEAKAVEHGIDVVDVEVAGSSKAPVVRVRIDNADEALPTISLDEISAQSDWINEVIDEVDPFPGAYSLEVSSPGLARPLRKERDFVRFAGNTVAITTTAREGRRKFTGVLAGVEDGQVVLTCDDGEQRIALDEIKQAKIKPNYDELMRSASSVKEGR